VADFEDCRRVSEGDGKSGSHQLEFHLMCLEGAVMKVARFL
jgi:hypothetical protein